MQKEIGMPAEKITSWFTGYTDRYNTQDPKIKLKILHTFRVAGLCRLIANSLHLSEEDADLAWTIGMLHDVGRFEQVRRYNTFADAQSVDHAQFGADLLFGEQMKPGADESEKAAAKAGETCAPLLQDFLPEYLGTEQAALMELAIRNHNTYRIAQGLTEREQMFCHIIRDADKIDILRVNMETPMEDIYNVTSEQLLQSDVTDAVMEACRERHAILRSLKKTPIDHLVGHISLTFELVYPMSLVLVKQQGYLQQLMDFPTKSEKTKAALAEIKEIMKDFLKNA